MVTHKAKIRAIDPDKRLKRYRVKEAAKYQNWQVWTLGADRLHLLTYCAKLETFRRWKRLYGDSIHTKQFVFLSLCRLYCGLHGVTFFKRSNVVKWAMQNGYLSGGFKMPETYNSVFRLLEGLQFINPLAHGPNYSLTNRAKLLFSDFDRILKRSFDPANTEKTLFDLKNSDPDNQRVRK